MRELRQRLDIGVVTGVPGAAKGIEALIVTAVHEIELCQFHEAHFSLVNRCFSLFSIHRITFISLSGV
jgi:hypothetical protein